MTDIEKYLSNGTIPWTNIEFRTQNYWVFKTNDDEYIFTPVCKNINDIVQCFKSAYTFGCEQYSHQKWIGFEISQVNGSSNSIDYPYVKLIPNYE